ncbi:MAG: outer membrane protein assembly factor BamA [Burkholderiales bacterium]|nr:outer membrane protein assembly factor BamA [Burkholderiales bacterium]MDE2288872.1 outer membrane protein assembly factor BamA [Burkholderiales bacterium]MDE2607939.1 outer membrane protein assembly factor BamA [Burkholderiales bacterium]
MSKKYHLLPKTLVTAVLAAYGLAAHAVTPFVVKDIRVEGLRRIEPGTVFAYLPVKTGELFNDEKGTEAIRALYATGLFSDVSVEEAPGDILVIHVDERPAISSVDFLGIKEFDKDALTKALSAVGLAVGQSFNRNLLDKAEQELKRQYLTRGYYAAEVKTTVTPMDSNRVGIQFSVTEGPKAEIRQINFVGNKAFSASDLRAEMELGTPNWFSWYSKNDLYSKEKLTGDLEKLRSFYLNRGYLEFNIDSTDVSITPDKQSMYLTLNLHEGEPYKVSGVKVVGDMLGKRDAIEKLVQLKAGDTFSAAKLQGTTKAITSMLGNYGFAFASVSAQPQVDRKNHTVALTLVVDPGRRFYVNKINIVGNSRTRDVVIRREMRQLESSWFDAAKLKLSKDRINRLGYFTDVDVTTQPVAGSPDQVNITVKVKEKPTGTINVGAGFSSTDKVVLTAGISQDNVFGSGTSLSMNVNTGKTYRTLTVTQVDPYFTVDGISRITDLYYRTYQPLLLTSNSDFRINTTGGSLKFGIPFSENDTVYFGIGMEQTKLHLTNDGTTPQRYIDYANQFGYVSNNYPFTIGWSRDTRDSALVPTEGHYQQANIEVGTPIGTTKYYRAFYQHQFYYPIARGYTLSMNGEIGYGHGFGGEPFPIFKNYYAGGIGSVRGYSPSSLGPHDTNGDPLGGASELIGNIEMSFPLPGTGYDRTLRVFTFLDGGNVFDEGQPYKLNELRYSYGFGLSWISPIGPLKISMGFPLVRKAGDQYQKFQFQVGTSF